MIDELTLLSGSDILFEPAQIVIHPPTLKEISYIGEETFLLGCNFLNFSKDKFLKDKDKMYLSNVSDFEVFIAIVMDTRPQAIEEKNKMVQVLELLFPEYKIDFNQSAILLQAEKQMPKTINMYNYDDFKSYIQDIFCLHEAGDDFNPIGKKSSAIAKKLAAARERRAKEKGGSKKINILSRFASIISVGLQIPMTEIEKYTVYQLYDNFTRFQLKMSFDANINARLAGATDLEDAENWMNDIHL